MDQSKACSQQRERCSQEEKVYYKGGEMPSGSSQHNERGVANKRDEQRGIMVLRGGQVIIG